MRCLSCWEEIDAPRAVYTRPCRHIFCVACSKAAFSRELACPLCDTVLPKDGVVEFAVRPDASALRAIASSSLGLGPGDLCGVLRAGLDFWDAHRANEDAHRQRQVATAREERDAAASAQRKAAMALEQERLTSRALRDEVAAAQAALADVERKYADKARAARKMSELYNDLRKVHRRLEADLLTANADEDRPTRGTTRPRGDPRIAATPDAGPERRRRGWHAAERAPRPAAGTDRMAAGAHYSTVEACSRPVGKYTSAVGAEAAEAGMEAAEIGMAAARSAEVAAAAAAGAALSPAAGASLAGGAGSTAGETVGLREGVWSGLAGGHGRGGYRSTSGYEDPPPQYAAGYGRGPRSQAQSYPRNLRGTSESRGPSLRNARGWDVERPRREPHARDGDVNAPAVGQTDSRIESRYFAREVRRENAEPEGSDPVERRARRGEAGRDGLHVLSPTARVFDLNPGIRKRHRIAKHR